MDSEAIALIIGAGATAVGAVTAAVRAASGAYRESVRRAATELENQRLADQATKTVAAKDAEILGLKQENARLWRLLEDCHQRIGAPIPPSV